MSWSEHKHITLEKEAHLNENGDLELWLEVKSGSEEAFEKFYKTHLGLLYNYGMKLCKDQGLVQDCIQDLFISLWQKKENLTLHSSLKYYLLQSFRRLIVKSLEKKKKVVLDEGSFLGSELQVVEPTSDDVKKEKVSVIKEAITTLPKRQKEAIYLKYFENLDYEEIASIMSIQVPAVYKLVSAGVKKLRTGVE